VDFKVRDIREGFDEKQVDALFLDVSNPYDYLQQVREALIPGGQFGCIVPTTNQVISMLFALRQHDFAFIEVCDISMRFYKTEPTRFRPADRMIAHTGYLVFARPVLVDRSVSDEKLMKEIGMLNLSDEAGSEYRDDKEI
jgi:tRNA (adenine57-N1/adenine58-N1)-methyltransferase